MRHMFKVRTGTSFLNDRSYIDGIYNRPYKILHYVDRLNTIYTTENSSKTIRRFDFRPLSKKGQHG
jgi:hypothetical protein